ncbi:hypothetical protein [Plantactinospora sp. GCM10030261]|uniref:hypothetical protein n=1 Tax=Plantactinospora sp. GCM10030261 TaxID=3273420 RepID=UPI003621EFDA
MTTTRDKRQVIRAMYTGLVITAIAMVVPYLDHVTGDMLADHIRAGYPTYPKDRIDAAATTYLVYLSVVGLLGAACWAWAIWAVRAGKRWAGTAATVLFVLGAGVALFNLLVRDTSGDTGLPPLLGWVGMLPSLVGLVVLALMWRTTRAEA